MPTAIQDLPAHQTVDIDLPFQVPTAALKGNTPYKHWAYLIVGFFAWIGVATAGTYLLEFALGTTAEGTPGHTWASVLVVGTFLGYALLARGICERGDTAQKNSRYKAGNEFNRTKFIPWLESIGMPEAPQVASNLIFGGHRAVIADTEIPRVGYDIDLSVDGINYDSHKIRVWRYIHEG